jgi:hypothetical protein
VLEPESGELVEEWFVASREALDDWAMRWRGSLAAVAIEATPGRRWVARELQTVGFDVRLADSGELRAGAFRRDVAVWCRVLIACGVEFDIEEPRRERWKCEGMSESAFAIRRDSIRQAAAGRAPVRKSPSAVELMSSDPIPAALPVRTHVPTRTSSDSTRVASGRSLRIWP